MNSEKEESQTLDEAVALWNKEVPQKWREVRQAKGHFISVYSPQWGHYVDGCNRRETSRQVQSWTVEWFKRRGHDIECVIMEDGESLAIRKSK